MPAASAGRDRGLDAPGDHGHQRLVAPAAAGDHPQLRLLGEMLARAGDAGRGEGRQRGRAVLGDESRATSSSEKALRSSDLGGGSPK